MKSSIYAEQAFTAAVAKTEDAGAMLDDCKDLPPDGVDDDDTDGYIGADDEGGRRVGF
jgi:hypothetical protein